MDSDLESIGGDSHRDFGDRLGETETWTIDSEI